jgi:hypothetical protein
LAFKSGNHAVGKDVEKVNLTKVAVPQIASNWAKVAIHLFGHIKIFNLQMI